MTNRSIYMAFVDIVGLEFRRHRRSRRMVGIVVALTVFCTFWSVHYLSISEYPPNASQRNTGVFSLIAPGQDVLLLDVATHPFVGPLLLCFGVLLGVGTVVSPRADGTLRTLQTLPYSRRAVFLGLLLSRLALTTGIVVTLTTTTFVVAGLSGVRLSLGLVPGFVGLLSIHIAGSVAVGTALSTLRTRPAAVYLLGIVGAVGLLVLGGLLSALQPVAGVLSPLTAFYIGLAGLQPNWTALFQQRQASVSVGTGLLVMYAWVLVPTLLGLISYERCDLDE